MARAPQTMNSNATESDLLANIFGDADPGDDGQQDEGNDDLGNSEIVDPDEQEERDTGPVSQDDQNEDYEEDNDSQQPIDSLARRANKARQDSKPQQNQQQSNQQRQQPSAQQTDPFDLKGKLQKDAKGNLYMNGKLVANTGREARIYFGFRKLAEADRKAAMGMAQHITKIAAGAKELFSRYDMLQKQKGIFDQVGLSIEEQARLVPIIVAYKKNPIDGLKLMLTQAHLSGVDIKSVVGGNAGSAIDPKALMDQMTGKMTELLQPVLSETSTRANQNSVRTEAEGFFTRNPRAKDVAKVVGGSHKLGLILKEAKLQAPDLTLDELFQRLDYALLSANSGQLPNTGPVSRKRPAGQRQERRMTKNFTRSLGPNSSYEDIAASVLQDVRDADARGI